MQKIEFSSFLATFLHWCEEKTHSKISLTLSKNEEIVIFLINFASGNFAVTRDGLDSRGAARHRVSPNHPEFQQN